MIQQRVTSVRNRIINSLHTVSHTTPTVTTSPMTTDKRHIPHTNELVVFESFLFNQIVLLLVLHLVDGVAQLLDDIVHLEGAEVQDGRRKHLFNASSRCRDNFQATTIDWQSTRIPYPAASKIAIQKASVREQFKKMSPRF